MTNTRYSGDMNNTKYTPETKSEREARVRATMQRYHSGAELRSILAKGQKAGK